MGSIRKTFPQNEVKREAGSIQSNRAMLAVVERPECCAIAE